MSLDDVYVTVTPLLEEMPCSAGNTEVRAIVAEATSPLGGSFRVSIAGAAVSISLDASAAEVEAAIESLDGVGDVQVTKSPHTDKAYGSAWVVTFMEAAPQDGIVVNDQYTTGYDASVSVYPLVNVSTTSQYDDLTGTWRITLGDEETIPLSYRATQNKVLEALDLLLAD